MPRIAQCPACQAQIAIPSGAGAAVRLRCPSCDAEFELEETTATTLQEAVLLETSAAANFLDFEGAEPDDVDPDMAIEDRFDFLDDDAGVDDDHISDDAIDGSPFEDVTNEVMDDLVDEEATAEVTVDAGAWAVAEEGVDDLVMEIPAAEPEEAAPWNFGESSNQSRHVAVGPSIASTTVAASMASRTAALRRPKKSFLRHTINFFGGGAIGLSLGYFILMWIGGPDRDFLELGNKLPEWMVPASFSERLLNRPLAIAEAPTAMPNSTTSTRRPPQSGSANLAEEQPEETPETTPKVPDRGPVATGLVASEEPVETGPVTPVGGAEATGPENMGEALSSPFDGLDAEPIVLGLRDAQPEALESLTKAINAAQAARADLLDGELADQATRPKKGRSYIAFCVLAETMTRVADAMTSGKTVDAPEADPVFLLDVAKQSISETIAGEKALGEVGTFGRLWFGKEDRTNRGIIAVGHMLDTYDCAPYFGLLLKLEGSPSTVPVVSIQPWSHAKGDRIVVAGLIVDAPADHLNNFPKTPACVIYVGQTFGSK